jgi:hypothetical protein
LLFLDLWLEGFEGPGKGLDVEVDGRSSCLVVVEEVDLEGGRSGADAAVAAICFGQYSFRIEVMNRGKDRRCSSDATARLGNCLPA